LDWVKNKWQPRVDAITTIVDMRDGEAMKHLKLPENIDAVVHLAANARVYELVEHPDRALDNFITLFHALEFARTNNVKKFIFASSREVYGNAKQPQYKEEMVHVEHCESPYTASKLGGEALVESYSRCYGIDHVIFRFSNVYGMYDDSERVVPLFFRGCRANETLHVFGKDKCLDFTYIDDTVSGIIASLEKFDSVKNATYNLAFGQGTTIVHLAERIKELLGSSSQIELGVPRTGEVVSYVADISKARQKLGYDPQTPFDRGIEKAVEWYKANT
jgi:nucleoside-diphosphate-sugar epimerase